MKICVETQVKNPLVERDELVVRIEETNATPSKVQVQESVAKLLQKQPGLIRVKHIHQKFGKKEASALIYCYHNEDALKKFEKPKEVKHAEKTQGEEGQAQKEA